jgi:hypothetical protein
MNRLSKFQTLTTKSGLLGNRLMLGGATAAIAAVVGTAGIAAAHPNDNNNDPTMPANVEMCKAHYEEFHYKNVGKCVSDFAKHHGSHGYGYGGEDDDHGHHHHHHHHFYDFFGNWWDHHFRH